MKRTKKTEKSKAIWNKKRKKWVHTFTQTVIFNQQWEKFLLIWKMRRVTLTTLTVQQNLCLAVQKSYKEMTLHWLMDAGPKNRALEVGYALFDYFVDIRSSLKGRLPQLTLLLKAQKLYGEYCKLKRHASRQTWRAEDYTPMHGYRNGTRSIGFLLSIPRSDFPFLKQEEKRDWYCS